MQRPNPALWYPPSAVLPHCSPEQAAVVMDENQRHLDHEAAAILDNVANAPREAWADRPTAVKLRRSLKLVAEHLRERGDG